jgi:dihydrofolate reductase
MTDVRVDMTISLDGFVCGLEAQKPPYLDDGFFRVTKWIVKYFDGVGAAENPAEAALVAERVDQTGAYVLGRRMYDSAGDHWSEEAPYHVPTFVVTHREHASVPLKDGTTFHFVTDGVVDAIERAKEAAAAQGPDKKVHVSGGADIVQQALAAGLVDELHIHIAPVLLGQGTRLFDHLPDGIVELDKYRVLDAADATHLSFRIKKG